jgi:hypothetical protein
LTGFFAHPKRDRGSIAECLFLLRSLTTNGVPTASRCAVIFSVTRVSAAIVVGSKRRCYKEIMNSKFSVADLSDAELISEVKARAARECGATAALVASLAELDARRLYLGEGCSSLFTYCTQVLRLSEHAAYGRIEAARAARRFPAILDLLADGAVTLTNVCLIAPLLTLENHRELLGSIRHKSKHEVEHLAAALRPRPPVPPVVRKLPTPKSAEAERTSPGTTEARPAVEVSADVVVPPARRPTVAPIAPEQYKVQFTVNAETHRKLRRAQDLLRHVIPNGDPAQIFDRALTLLVAELEKKKLAAATRRRPSGNARAWSPRACCREAGSVEARTTRMKASGSSARCGFANGLNQIRGLGPDRVELRSHEPLANSSARIHPPTPPNIAPSAVTRATVWRIPDIDMSLAGRPGPIVQEIAQPAVDSISAIAAPARTDGTTEPPLWLRNPTAR